MPFFRRRSCDIILFLVVIYVSQSTYTDAFTNSTSSDGYKKYYLDKNSVVLITGSVGFIGSELALALHHTYDVKKLICIDSMENGFSAKTVPTKAANTDADDDFQSTQHQSSKNARDLSLFEFKRQRLFRLVQATGSKVHFYRADFRPSIPEYFDGTEIPLLHYIFTREHPDITHVVHLADHYHRTPRSTSTSDEEVNDDEDEEIMIQAVPRAKAEEKAGMIESILEQLRYQQKTTGSAPHFVYASSGDVYDFYASSASNTDPNSNHPNPPPFQEHLPITTPSTIAGTSKLLDEIIAQTYNDIVQPNYLKSVGLRFFEIYGPWSLPGSSIFEMAESAVLGTSVTTSTDTTRGSTTTLTKNTISQKLLDHVKDYCYIDDAVDAIMAAMQYEPPNSNPAIVFNVGSGQGTTLRSIARMMNDIVSSSSSLSSINHHRDEDYAVRVPPTVSIANISRSRAVLGYQPQVTLREGLEQTLAWHYDRVYPYGTGAVTSENDNSNHIANKGMVSCTSPHDIECLKGNIAFPCASDCNNPQQCVKTLYDDVLELTRAITSECTTVMYTVSLEPTIDDIPSVHVRVSSQSIPYVQGEGGGYCNVAFVPDTSPLFIKAKQNAASSGATTKRSSSIVQFEFWTLIPVAVTSYVHSYDTFMSNITSSSLFSIANNRDMLELIPKLSPGFFFGTKVQHAIYCDMDIVFDNIPRLVQEAMMQPQQKIPRNAKDSKRIKQGATIMLIGRKQSISTSNFAFGTGSANDYGTRPLFTGTTNTVPYPIIQQDMAYRTIRMALINDLVTDDSSGLIQMVDSSFIVHNNLRSPRTESNKKNSVNVDDDARYFRCDILGEVLQWNVPTDGSAIEFITSLHDMWSRIMVEKQDGIKPWWVGKDVTTIPSGTARIHNVDANAADDLNIMFGDSNEQSHHRRLQEVLEQQPYRRLEEEADQEENEENDTAEEEEEEEDEEEEQVQDELPEVDVSYGAGDASVDDDSADTDEEAKGAGDTNLGDHNGFGVVQEAIQAVFGGVGIGKNKQQQQLEQQKKVVERYEQPIESEENYEEQEDKDTPEIDDFVVHDDDDDKTNDDDETASGTTNAAGSGHTTSRIEKQEHHQRSAASEGSAATTDPSSYDVWLGVLSSNPNVQYYSRIVSLEAVGVYRISHYYDDDPNNSNKQTSTLES